MDVSSNHCRVTVEGGQVSEKANKCVLFLQVYTELGKRDSDWIKKLTLSLLPLISPGYYLQKGWEGVSRGVWYYLCCPSARSMCQVRFYKMEDENFLRQPKSHCHRLRNSLLWSMTPCGILFHLDSTRSREMIFKNHCGLEGFVKKDNYFPEVPQVPLEGATLWFSSGV